MEPTIYKELKHIYADPKPKDPHSLLLSSWRCLQSRLPIASVLFPRLQVGLVLGGRWGWAGGLENEVTLLELSFALESFYGLT